MTDDIISEVKPKPNLKPTKLDLTSAIPLSRGIGVLEAPEKRPVGRPPKPPPPPAPLQKRLDQFPLAVAANTVTLDVIIAKYLRLLEITTDISVVDPRSGKPVLFDGNTSRAALKDLAELLGFTGNNSSAQFKAILDLDQLEAMIQSCQEAISYGVVLPPEK